jgi:hypothetical protein
MRSFTRQICTLTVAAAALCPSLSQAVGWGNWWTVYDTYWPMPRYYNSYDDATGAGCPSSGPPSVFSASANGVAAVGGFRALVDVPCDIQCILNGGKKTIALVNNNTSVGSVSAAAGSPVTLDWACQDIRYCTYTKQHCGTTFGGCNFGSTDGGTIKATYYSSASGTNFSTGGAMGGSTIVYPTKTTTYTLYCYASNLPNSLSITVNVTAACGPSLGTAPGNSNGWVLPKGTTRQFNAGGYNKCLTNNGSYDLFIPGKTQAELNTFFSHPPSGVTIK